MKFGVSLFATDYSIRPAEAARAAEEAGLESIWFPEHSHMPVSTVFPLSGGEVPREYRSLLDPFVALASAAAVTSRIRLGTGVALVTQRDPLLLAKEVATLDVISNGRVILGIGAGWNEQEMMNHGTDPGRRFRLMRERIEAMKRVWTEDEAEYHGDVVSFDRVWSYPKPVQKPHPPIIVGGTGRHILKRIARYGDGWMPIAFTLSFDSLADQIAELRRICQEAGRSRPEVTVFGVPTDPEGIAKYEAIGVDRAVWGLPPEGADVVLPRIERYGQAIRAATG